MWEAALRLKIPLSWSREADKAVCFLTVGEVCPQVIRIKVNQAVRLSRQPGFLRRKERIMEGKALIMDEKAMGRAINRIAYEIIERGKGAEDLVIVGIVSRGVELAHRIAGKIKSVEQREVPVGTLDITPYRDDLPRPGSPPAEPGIPFPIDGKRVVLVDDVICTGRSVRAAMDGLLSIGRPRCIMLAVLVDRGHRELPVRADFIGKNVPTSREEEVCVFVKERDGQDCVVIR